MDELFGFLEKLIVRSIFPVEFPGDRECTLNRWLVKSESGQCFDDGNIKPYLNPCGELLLEQETASLPQKILDINWRYYISELKHSFYRYNMPQELFADDEDRYIYSVCSVYCKKEQDIFICFHSQLSTPVRVWINGRLIISSGLEYDLKNNSLLFRFKKGRNIILVENMQLRRHKTPSISAESFCMELKPYNLIMDNKSDLALLNEKYLNNMKNSYCIIPDKLIFRPGQNLSFTVLPRYFGKAAKEKIHISIFKPEGGKVAHLKAFTSERITIKLDKSVRGVLLLKAGNLNNHKKASIFVFRGSFLKERDRLLELAAQRSDCSQEIIDSIEKLNTIPTDYECLKKACHESMDYNLCQHTFEKYFEFEKYIYSLPGDKKKELFNVFNSNVTLCKKNEFYKDSTEYSIYLPKEYNHKKVYPLVIYMMYDDSLSKYRETPDFIVKGEFRDAIIAAVYLRDGYVSYCYMDEVNIINEIAGKFNVNKDRIYLIGLNKGALKSINFAIKFPDIFAAVAAFSGTAGLDVKNPEYRYLKNLDNTMFYQISNIDDYSFNSARVLHMLNYMNKFKKWVFHSYSPNIFRDMFNSEKLLSKIIKERKVKYPRQVHYTTYQPIYNKSFWIKIDYIKDLSYIAEISAEIKAKNLIDISMHNIKCFSMLLSEDLMELDREVEIFVNSKKIKVNMEKFTKVNIILDEQDIICKTTSITEQQFHNEYNFIGIDKNPMGIKEVFLNKCIIIKPNQYRGNNELADALFGVLQSHLKEGDEDFICNVIQESEADEYKLSKSNLIYLIDCGDIDTRIKLMGSKIGLDFDIQHINYKNNKFYGDYFAVIKCRNPYDESKLALFIIYNGEKMGEELMILLKATSISEFYSEAIIYNNGQYHFLR